ncbi:hypothetical protein AVEN_3877-1, partial [Araneus ventricosus]
MMKTTPNPAHKSPTETEDRRGQVEGLDFGAGGFQVRNPIPKKNHR